MGLGSLNLAVVSDVCACVSEQVMTDGCFCIKMPALTSCTSIMGGRQDV